MGFYTDFADLTGKRKGSKHNIDRQEYLSRPQDFAPDCKSRRKLTVEQVREIRIAHSQRQELLLQLNAIPTIRHFASVHGMTKESILKIAEGMTYKEIR